MVRPFPRYAHQPPSEQQRDAKNRISRFCTLLRDPDIRPALEKSGLNISPQRSRDQFKSDMVSEVKALAGQPGFVSGDQLPARPDAVSPEYITKEISNAHDTIRLRAPLLDDLLGVLLSHRHSHHHGHKQGKQSRKLIQAQTYLIASFFAKAHRPQSANFLHNAIGWYLDDSRCPKPVIDTLNGLGICASAKTIDRQRQELSDNMVSREGEGEESRNANEQTLPPPTL